METFKDSAAPSVRLSADLFNRAMARLGCPAHSAPGVWSVQAALLLDQWLCKEEARETAARNKELRDQQFFWGK